MNKEQKAAIQARMMMDQRWSESKNNADYDRWLAISKGKAIPCPEEIYKVFGLVVAEIATQELERKSVENS